MPTRLLPARGRLAWIKISFSISFCVGLDRGGVRRSFAVGTSSRFETRPAPSCQDVSIGTPPSLDRESLFPASRNTEKAMFWMRHVRSQVADVKDSNGEFAYH